MRSGIKFDDAKKYVQAVVDSLREALQQPKVKEVGSDDHTAVAHQAGKLAALMEFVETALINVEEDSSKIFGDDAEFEKISEVIGECAEVGVQLL